MIYQLPAVCYCKKDMRSHLEALVHISECVQYRKSLIDHHGKDEVMLFIKQSYSAMEPGALEAVDAIKSHEHY